MVALAAALFAVNGTVSKIILGSEISAQQLTEVRCAGALVGLTLIAFATRPGSLPLQRNERRSSWHSESAVSRSCSGRTSKAQRPDGAGLAAAALAAVTYAGYILLAERGVRRRDPISLSAWGFLFATLFWSVLAPWWHFPAARADNRATRAGITGMLEPVLAIVVAWAWLGETLNLLQASGATVTLAGIAIAQTSR